MAHTNIRYALSPVYAEGRANCTELADFANYTYNAHGSDYLSVIDNSSLKLDRYLAKSDSYGITNVTHDDIVKQLEQLPIGSVVRHINIGYGYRNQKYDASRNWVKVTDTQWVLRD